MGFFSNRYSKPGPGIEKNAPSKKGLALFFDILFREFFELFKLNLLFLLFCIPIITIPAALTAMSRLTLTMVQDKPHFLWRDFFDAFKANFKTSALAGLMLFAGLFIAGYSAYFYGLSTRTNALFYVPLGISLCLVYALTVISFYLFPLIALVDLPLKVLIKNALLLTFICLPHNLATFAATGLLVFLFVGFFPVSLPFILIAFFALLNLISTFCAYSGIKRYVIQKDQ
ncbi:DUF624 domain-containing protein [Oscillospiraceae bacterium PP1C4]